MEIIPRPGLQ